MKGHRLFIFILAVGVFGILNTEMGVIGLLPYVSAYFGVSISEAGALVSLFALIVAVSGPVMPLLMSRFERKKAMLFVLAVFIAGNVISAVTDSFAILLAARVIPAFFHPVYCALAFSAAAEAVPQEYAPDAVGKVMVGVAAGMVLGVAFLFAFTGSPIQNTFIIIILLNSVREFTTPYLMIQASLSKINMSWETTGALMGDSWLKTIFRVIIPNTMSTVFQMLSYIFIQAMVTISAIIFVTGARTMVMTTKITQAQYFEKYDEVFVLSLLIFLTNIIVKVIFDYLSSHDDIVLHVKQKFQSIFGKEAKRQNAGLEDLPERI